MKIQLFVPPGGYFAERWSKGTSMPPLGLLYIAAVLEKEGYEVRVVPADILKLGWNQIKKEIKNFEPDFIGVTSTTENRFQSFKLIKTAKKTYPQALTILGGPHASMAAEDCLVNIPELDVVVRGEGELTMLELCQASKKNRESFASIKGISLRKNGKIKTNPQRPLISDLDSLPYPAFHLIPFEKYGFFLEVPGQGRFRAINLMSSRGCPFNCNFCATPINWGRQIRLRSPQNTIDEIEYLIKRYGIQSVFFFDDTFNANPSRVKQICSLITERKLNIFWKCDVRADLMDKPLLTEMKRAGLFHLSFGLEAGSERVRKEIINKPINTDHFHQIVKWCRELSIIPNAFFIFSHPSETWEEAQETLNIIEQYKDKIEANIAVLHVYPGTPLEKTAKKLGVFPLDFSWTRRHQSQIITLPAVQGDAPLFQDILSWSQISELIFRWTLSGGKLRIFRKIPKIITKIRSWADIKRYAIMAYAYLKLRLRK